MFPCLRVRSCRKKQWAARNRVQGLGPDKQVSGSVVPGQDFVSGVFPAENGLVIENRKVWVGLREISQR